MIDKPEKAKQIILLSAIDEESALYVIETIKRDLELPEDDIYKYLVEFEAKNVISFYTYDDFDNITDGSLESFKPALQNGSTEIFLAKVPTTG
jgi:hypothetical protein